MRRIKKIMIIVMMILGSLPVTKVEAIKASYDVYEHMFVPMTDGKPDFMVDIINPNNNKIRFSLLKKQVEDKKPVEIGMLWPMDYSEAEKVIDNIFEVYTADYNWANGAFVQWMSKTKIDDWYLEGDRMIWDVSATCDLQLPNERKEYWYFIRFDNDVMWNGRINYRNLTWYWKTGYEYRAVNWFDFSSIDNVTYGIFPIEEWKTKRERELEEKLKNLKVQKEELEGGMKKIKDEKKKLSKQIEELIQKMKELKMELKKKEMIEEKSKEQTKELERMRNELKKEIEEVAKKENEQRLEILELKQKEIKLEEEKRWYKEQEMILREELEKERNKQNKIEFQIKEMNERIDKLAQRTTTPTQVYNLTKQYGYVEDEKKKERVMIDTEIAKRRDSLNKKELKPKEELEVPKTGKEMNKKGLEFVVGIVVATGFWWGSWLIMGRKNKRVIMKV